MENTTVARVARQMLDASVEEDGWPLAGRKGLLARAQLAAAFYGTPVGKMEAEMQRQIALRAERAERRNVPPQVPACCRVDQHLLRMCHREIRRRRLSRPTGWHNGSGIVTDRDVTRRLWVVWDCYSYEYSKGYTRRFGARDVTGAYFCGFEDGQYFAVRVPSHVRSVASAEAWLMPKRVHEARERLRQGDVYFIPARRDNLVQLPFGHKWDGDARVVRHEQHGELVIPPSWPGVRAVQARAMSVGGGGD